MPARTSEQDEQAQKARYLRAVSRVGTLTAGCKAARVSPHTVYSWREHDTEFTIAEHDARERCADELEAAVIRRGKTQSDTAAIFMLKAMRPAKYRDNSRVEVTGKDGGPVDLSLEPTDRIARRIAQLATRVGAGRVPGEPAAG